ncbi:MAG: photosystem II S4 domain protein [Synechococcus sp.]
MSLPKESLLQGSQNAEALAALLDRAEHVLKTWQPCWSDFVAAPLREELLERCSSLSELNWQGEGGYPGAERQRLLCSRSDTEPTEAAEPTPVSGLVIEGNFLFDPITPEDLRQALIELGASPSALGDIWVRGDRGGQAVLTPEQATALDGAQGQLRDVAIRCDQVSLDQLQLPAQRIPKQLTSVEASCRLDAIASAGFGLSRAKVVTQIKAGKLRLNWNPIRQGSRDLRVGDRLHLQDRGSVEVLTLTLTKRQRWRVELLRR